MTNSINDILNGVTLTHGNVTTPSYTISTSPWVGGATGATYDNVTWASPNTWATSGSFTVNPITGSNGGGNISAGKIELNGKNADIVVNGESLVSMLKRIEERMNILSVNHKLEDEWEELRRLGEEYRELEKHIIEKMKTWDKLKAQDNDNR